MLTVLSRLRESRAAAARGDALATESDAHIVRIRVRAADRAGGHRFFDVDLLNDLSFFVVEPAQESTSTKETSEAAIGESGKSV